MVGIDKSHLEVTAFVVFYPMRLSDLERDDASLFLHVWGVVEDQSGGYGRAVDGAGAEAAGEAFWAGWRRGEVERERGRGGERGRRK